MRMQAAWKEKVMEEAVRALFSKFYSLQKDVKRRKSYPTAAAAAAARKTTG